MIIAFCANGRKTGKNTAAGFIKQWCVSNGRTYEQLALGDQMKQLCAAALDMTPERLEGVMDPIPDPLVLMDQLKLKGSVYWCPNEALSVQTMDVPHPKDAPTVVLNGRDFIINLAEGARKLFGQDFWVLQILPRGWENDVTRADYTVITDLQFPEEANRVAECGGVVIEVQRPGAETGRSEGMLPDLYIDGRIQNDSTPESFQQRIVRMMAEFDSGK